MATPRLTRGKPRLSTLGRNRPASIATAACRSADPARPRSRARRDVHHAVGDDRCCFDRSDAGRLIDPQRFQPATLSGELRERRKAMRAVRTRVRQPLPVVACLCGRAAHRRAAITTAVRAGLRRPTLALILHLQAREVRHQIVEIAAEIRDAYDGISVPSSSRSSADSSDFCSTCTVPRASRTCTRTRPRSRGCRESRPGLRPGLDHQISGWVCRRRFHHDVPQIRRAA